MLHGVFFVRALAYADDFVIIVHTSTAMRKLRAICDD